MGPGSQCKQFLSCSSALFPQPETSPLEPGWYIRNWLISEQNVVITPIPTAATPVREMPSGTPQSTIFLPGCPPPQCQVPIGTFYSSRCGPGSPPQEFIHVGLIFTCSFSQNSLYGAWSGSPVLLLTHIWGQDGERLVNCPGYL